MINTHKGVLYKKSRAFGTDYIVHVIDLKAVRMQIVTGFNSVNVSTLAHGADLGFNNVGWGSHKRGPGVPNDLLWADGRAIQNSPIDWRRFFSMNILQSGEIRFDTILRKAWNVIGFDRIIGKNDEFNKLVTDVSRAPRTVYGKDMAGRLAILTCEGRAVSQMGLTFKECWEILHNDHAVTDAGNADGGGSTCAMNTAISKEPLINYYKREYRAVVSRTLFYAERLDTPELPMATVGDNLQADADRLNDPELSMHVGELRSKHPEVF